MPHIDINHMHDMNKNIDTSTPADTTSTLLNAPPFTLEAFRGDIANVVMHYLRALGCITGDAALSTPVTQAAFKVTNLTGLFNPECVAADIGLTYECIRDTSFARLMDVLYDFAFHGRLDASAEAMAYESTYMWIADLLMDAREGHYAEQWDSYGAAISTSAENCLLVAELANARHILEGGEGFSYFSRGRGKGDDSTLDGLTIRQMALLAGMEEMSVRAAANPKRANPLKTDNDNGRTYIARDIAKAWLQSKGRYVPVMRYWSAGEVNLKQRRFANPHELAEALEARRNALMAHRGSTLHRALVAAGVPFMKASAGFCIDPDIVERFDDADFMTRIAELLDLPTDWLVLRAQEAFATRRLAEIERQLRALGQSSD
ncbi:hypothetical protein [Burkholderia sp. Ac-20353]|uniref:hypothetical protein n=1 Tax=Burkholderia sp. Ac-20353 TaxID=2703894 RepID=UPI00197B9370|nr:hypothetical protein [Burkholderia sp. Ac-20353]MBN3788853.1 hypothetical protein [Burkholderia sp. Ac-20353]